MFEWVDRLLGRQNGMQISEAHWRAVEADLPFLQYLSADARLRLRAMALDFLQQKVFSGAQGFEPNNHVRLSIALQACLPVLELGLACYTGWIGIIVYPQAFVIARREMDEAGVMHEFDDEVLGEAWSDGPVVLAWFDDQAEYAGANVVIHEFAHKLDMLNGEADGVPPLHAGMSVQDWMAAQDVAMDALNAEIDAAELAEAAGDASAWDGLSLDPYAAHDPAEFFAVSSEIFFTDPLRLMHAYPSVYAQYAVFYRQNPAAGAHLALANAL